MTDDHEPGTEEAVETPAEASAPPVQHQQLPGRPPWFKRLPLKLKLLCKALALGNSQKNACEMIGLHTSTFYRSMQTADLILKLGKDLDSEDLTDSERDYLEFWDRVKNAESKSIHRYVRRIERASCKTWQAAAWMLERLRPHEYGKVERHELSGPDGGPIRQKHEGNVKLMTDAELEGIILAGGGEIPVSAMQATSDAMASEVAMTSLLSEEGAEGPQADPDDDDLSTAPVD